MKTRRCFLCSVRIGRQHVSLTLYVDGQRHLLRLCYGCGLPDLRDRDGAILRMCESVDAKLKDIKALEGSGR